MTAGEISNHPPTGRVLPLLLTEDDVAALDWIGCPFEAEPDETLRAILHHVLHETRRYRQGTEAEELGLVIHRLRSADEARAT